MADVVLCCGGFVSMPNAAPWMTDANVQTGRFIAPAGGGWWGRRSAGSSLRLVRVRHMEGVATVGLDRLPSFDCRLATRGVSFRQPILYDWWCAMQRYKGRYRIESARLPTYDYRSPGWYHVVICTAGRACAGRGSAGHHGVDGARLHRRPRMATHASRAPLCAARSVECHAQPCAPTGGHNLVDPRFFWQPDVNNTARPFAGCYHGPIQSALHETHPTARISCVWLAVPVL